MKKKKKALDGNGRQHQHDLKSNETVSSKGRECRPVRHINRRKSFNRRSGSVRNLYKSDMRKQILRTSSSADLLKELRLRESVDIPAREETNATKKVDGSKEAESTLSTLDANNTPSPDPVEGRKHAVDSNVDESQTKKEEAEEHLRRIIESSRELKQMSNSGQLHLFSQLFSSLDEEERNMVSSDFLLDNDDANIQNDEKHPLSKKGDTQKKGMAVHGVMKAISTLKSKQDRRNSKKEKILDRIDRASVREY